MKSSIQNTVNKIGIVEQDAVNPEGDFELNENLAGQWNELNNSAVEKLVDVIKNESAIVAIEYGYKPIEKAFESNNGQKILEEGIIINKALEKLPDNPVLMYLYAYFQMKSGNYSLGAYLLSELRESNPELPYVNRSLGFCYLQLGKHAEAKELYEEAASMEHIYDPTNVWIIYHNLGNVYMATGEYQKSLANYSRAIELNPNQPFNFQNMAIVHLELNDLDNAIRYGQKAVALRSYPAAHKALGAAYRGNKQYDEAEKQLKVAISQAPYYVDALHELVLVYMAVDKLDLAEKTCAKVLEINPEHSAVTALLGEIYNKQKKYDKAIEHSLRILQVDTKNGFAEQQLHVAYAFKDDPKLNLEKFLRKRDVAIQMRRDARAKSKQGLYGEAIDLLKEVVEKNPYDYWSCYSLAWNLNKIGSYNESIKYLRTALELNPFSQKIGRDLVRMLVKVGKDDEAKKIIDDYSLD